MSKEACVETVLIIDDQPENIDVLSNILRPEYKVIAATSCDKARKIIYEKNVPDLILLDVMMPGVDGYELCAGLKNDDRSRHIPVIFVTALQHDVGYARAVEAGGVDYINKPVKPQDVLDRVRKHLDERKV